MKVKEIFEDAIDADTKKLLTNYNDLSAQVSNGIKRVNATIDSNGNANKRIGSRKQKRVG